jgi:hypothetical protein
VGPPIDTEPWTRATAPYSWLPVARPAQRGMKAVSTCELEADCVAPDILNRTYAIRTPLASAGEISIRLMVSLFLCLPVDACMHCSGLANCDVHYQSFT